MVKIIIEQLNNTTINENLIQLVANLIIITVILLIGFIVNFIARNLILKYVKKLALKTSTTLDDLFIEKKVFHNLAHLAPAATVYVLANQLSLYTSIIQKFTMTFMIIIVVISTFNALDSIVEYTRFRSPTKGGPLKGIIQVFKITLIVFSTLLVIVNFMGNSTAWAIFSGIGGMSAILMLIFKDSILGLVAGFQLSSEKLLNLGDWLEMPKYNADGEVVDISLSKITVRNWDKTYTSIPAYKFIEDSFKNWEGMSKSGGRRIMRSIKIDMTTIGFLSQTEIEELKEVNLLKPYLEEKQKELSNSNYSNNVKENLNSRKLTNIGTFRAYIELYLKTHPNVHQDYTLMVRQLEPTISGLPLEIYCFTNTTAWVSYEGIQSDIFDHLLAIVPEFGLQIYQMPTGSDFQNLLHTD